MSGPPARWRTVTWRVVVGAERWAAQRIGPYPLLAVTLLVGALVSVAMTVTSVEIYESVAEADGVAVLDRPALHVAVAARTPQLNVAVTAFTNLGGAVGMTVLATVVTIALAVAGRWWTPVVLMAAAAAGSLLMTMVGKAAVGRIRPPVAAAVPPYETSGSFPSGHALNAVVIAGVVAYVIVMRQRRWDMRLVTASLAAAFAVAMGLSRVFLGHHWLTDVLVAWALGLAWLSIVVVAHRLYCAVRRVRRLAPGKR